MSVRSEATVEIICKPEVFVCDLCPVRVRTLVAPDIFGGSIPWQSGHERWKKF